MYDAKIWLQFWSYGDFSAIFWSFKEKVWSFFKVWIWQHCVLKTNFTRTLTSLKRSYSNLIKQKDTEVPFHCFSRTVHQINKWGLNRSFNSDKFQIQSKAVPATYFLKPTFIASSISLVFHNLAMQYSTHCYFSTLRCICPVSA